MKTDKSQVEDLVLVFVNDYQKHKLQLTNALKGRVSIRKINGVFNGKILPEQFSEKELYYIAKAFYEITDELSINPEKFFTPIEITNCESEPLIESDDERDNIIILHNVVEVIPDKRWDCTKESYYNLVLPFKKGLVSYDERMQRETQKKSLMNTIIQRPKIYTKNVQQMKALMLKHKFEIDPISFNILNNGEADFEYDKEELTLTIRVTTKSIVNIIDGLHRSLAMMSVLEEDPDYEDIMSAIITHKTVAEAQEKIRQQNQRTPISVQKTKAFDISNEFMMIAKGVNEYETESTNMLFGKLGFEDTDITLLNKYCTLEVFSEAIENNFEIKTPKDSRKITEYLVKFFNELLGTFYEDVKDIKNSRKINAKLQQYTFAGYVSLAGKLYNQKNWIDVLEVILDEIDWNLNNPVWSELRITQSNLKNKATKEIYNYFKNLTNELLEGNEGNNDKLQTV